MSEVGAAERSGVRYLARGRSRAPGAWRVLFVEPAVLRVDAPPGGSRLPVQTVDLGVGGARIIASEDIIDAGGLCLEVAVPLRGSAVHLELPAVVRWKLHLLDTVLACSGFLHGLGFEDLAAGQIADLRRALAELHILDRHVLHRRPHT